MSDTLKQMFRQRAERKLAEQMFKEYRIPPASRDNVTVKINMKEPASQNSVDVEKNLKKGANVPRTEAQKRAEGLDDFESEEAPDPQMEVKITINMKQLEKHHREIDSYISPFLPSPDSIFLRIPPRPEDYARIENARDELDKLVRYVGRITPTVIPESEARAFLQKLRRLDVRLSAMYPRPPAPGDKSKKSYRMCPCYEPEMNDLERLIVHYHELFQGMSYLYRLNQHLNAKPYTGKKDFYKPPDTEVGTPQEQF